MYWVYILHSQVDNNFYIGFSKNVEKRITEHNAGHVRATRGRRPLELVRKEEFETMKLAVQREKYLKGKGGIRLKKKLRMDITSKMNLMGPVGA